VDPRTHARRAVPYAPAEWTRVCGRLSGLLLDVAERERRIGPMAR
jgi:hypothetical protein